MAITMTEKAAAHVRQQLDQRGAGLGIRCRCCEQLAVLDCLMS